MPGTDIDEAVRLVFGELPDLPYLPELPARGVGADMIGRSAALLTQLPVEVQPSGWRLTSRPGRDVRRARDLWARDLDALEANTDGYAGPLKVQVAGPWTLAAGLELPSGHRVVSDPGAVRDVAQSLADGLRRHLTELRARVAGANVVVQLDEPSLPAVLAGEISTPSGHGTVRAVEGATVRATLADVLLEAPEAGRVVHCCASRVPIALLIAAEASAVSLDLSQVGTASNDALGQAVDGGVSLWLGVLPSTDATISLDTGREPIRRLWGELGFSADDLAGAVVPTPACGLAGASPDYARRALAVIRDVGRALLD